VKVAGLHVPDPFLEDRHRALIDRVQAFGDRHLRASIEDERRPAERTKELVARLAEADLLPYAVVGREGFDLRSLVVIREQLAFFSALADTALVMQGLGSFAIARAGTDAQRTRWLPDVVSGGVIAAFAVTEPEAGSDLAGVRTRAEADGPVWRLDGVKTLISNAPIAGLFTVLARSSEAPEHKGLSMFLVDAGSPGITVKALEPMSPHPLGEVRFSGTPGLLLGEEGKGYALALAALDTFRPSVGAAACGLAARALDEAVRWSMSRRQFTKPIADFQAVQIKLADMQTELQAARLLVRQAAWRRDTGAERITAEGAMAKLFATEAAQRIVDHAVQIHGGQGVLRGATVERLYREVRSLRIYEGTSEIQKLVIARHVLRESR
jgi:acyl-CoA dehydrogenase